MMKNVGVVVRKNLEMIFEGFPRSELVEKDIRDRVARLEENSDKIITWRVHLELKHDGQHQGCTFHVRISAHIRGRDLVVSQIRHDKHAHEDLKVAIRDAFASMSRQLEGEQGTVRANVKAHELPLHGVVEKMDYIEGHGIIRTSDDRRIYFNLNSVLDNMFYSLEPGSEVRFVEHEGDLGSQASRVYVLGTHHEVGQMTDSLRYHDAVLAIGRQATKVVPAESSATGIADNKEGGGERTSTRASVEWFKVQQHGCL